MKFVLYPSMWTAGYDVYSPPRSVFYHDYKNTLSSSSDLTEWIDMGMVGMLILDLRAIKTDNMLM